MKRRLPRLSDDYFEALERLADAAIALYEYEGDSVARIGELRRALDGCIDKVRAARESA